MPRLSRSTVDALAAGVSHMSQTKGTMSGGLHISAAWAKTINHLVGMNLVHTGETIGGGQDVLSRGAPAAVRRENHRVCWGWCSVRLYTTLKPWG
jgi:hypothetical protein